MVRRVRDRFEVFRPVLLAKSCRHSGCVATITSSNARFLLDRILAKLSGDVNQTFGSVARGFNSPRAMASVRAFISCAEAMPTFNVFIVVFPVPVELHLLHARNLPTAWRHPGTHRCAQCAGGVCGRTLPVAATQAP